MSQKSCLRSYDGAQKSLEPKLSFMGPHFLMDKTWKRLIPLSLSKKQPKNNFQGQTLPSLGEIA